jgi:hypothetical protein
VLKDFDFNQWDKDFTMVQLHSKYSVNLFFKINVVPDDRAAGKYIIQVFWDYIIRNFTVWSLLKSVLQNDFRYLHPDWVCPIEGITLEVRKIR